MIFGMKNVNFVWNCIDIGRCFAYNTKGNKYKPTQNYINKPKTNPVLGE